MNLHGNNKRDLANERCLLFRALKESGVDSDQATEAAYQALRRFDEQLETEWQK